MDDYAPRSPDLSGIDPQYSASHTSYAYPPPPPTRQDSSFALEASYYQPPPLPSHSSTAYSHSAYDPLPKLEPQTSWPPEQSQPAQARRPGRPKRENTSQDDAGAIRDDSTQYPTSKGRKPSMKSQRPPPPEPEPRLPAPGDAEGIVVRTKFPAARIKRIVQADEEVGKVAQATPVAVGKALELFMIQMSLAAIADAKARGSKRVTGQNVKKAITQDDKFDFLHEIGDKIPEGPGKGEGKGKSVKAERGTSEDDVDMDDEDASKGPRKRRKRRPVDDD